MREFRIKVNNEKTYVVKATDYNQAVKTLHSKLRDFDDTKKNINVVREFITNNGGKFSKSKDADAILDFIYKKTGVKNADYGDVLYIVRNYTNVKVDDNTINDKPIKKWVLQSTINPILYLGEDKVAVPGAYRGKQFITKSDAEKWYYSMMSEPLGSKNATFKVVEAVVANDSSINDLVSKYNGEDAIRTNGFVKIKEDGDWTSYKYNGSDFDDAVFKIHQYNPSLIAFISNGNRTITVRNKYLNDADDTAQGEIEVLKSFGFDYKDGRWVKESNNNTISVQPDYHYVSVIGPGDTEKHCKKYQYQSAGMLKKIISSNIQDSHINDYSPKYNKGQKLQTSAGVHEIIGYDPVRADVHTNRIEYSYRLKTPNGTYTNIPDWQLEELVKLGRYKLIDSDIKDNDSYQVWTINEKGVYHKEAEVSDPQSAKAIASQLKKQGRWVQISKNSKTNIVSDSDITDADPVKVEKIIRKEKSALGITYYLFQTKSNSGATIYYEVTDKTYHGEPTYSGGGVISFSLKTANDSLDSHLLSDKLKAKYGEKEGTKRYLRGENDSAIHDMAETDMSMLQKATRVPAHNIYHNRISYDDLKRTINKVMEEGNDKDVVNILIGQLAELKKDYETDINNSKLDKEETKRHYNEYKRLVNNYKNSQISKEYTKAVNNFLSAIKDSNNIKNRKSYTIKVGDKQYKVFAESESEAINKYIKSKKQ